MDIVHSLGRGEKRMSRELYACIHATEFAAQALLRLRTDLKSEPVAIVDGPLHDACVCSILLNCGRLQSAYRLWKRS